MSNYAYSDSLKHRIALFRNRGRLFIEDDNLFRLDSWLAVLHGQGIMPEAYDPMVETKDEAKINKSLLDIHTSFIKTTNTLPTHDQYIKQHCRANFLKTFDWINLSYINRPEPSTHKEKKEL